jgi:hypothetical protein
MKTNTLQETQRTFLHNIEAPSPNDFCPGKAISITHFCACACMRACDKERAALVIQHAQRMRRIILPYVTLQAQSYFSTLSHKRNDFLGGGGEVIENKMCVLVFSLQLSSEKCLT